MAPSKWEMFGSYFRAYSSETYTDTVRAIENLAGSSLALLDRKSSEERRDILARAESLTEKIFDAVETEAPLVVALALIAALRTHEQFIQRQAEQNRKKNK
jgi:hypothetical protein